MSDLVKSIFVLIVMLCSCQQSIKVTDTTEIAVVELPKKLNEISGLTFTDGALWAISDKPDAVIYKLTDAGDIVEQVKIDNVAVEDVEAITSDANNLYLCDVGDNEGKRSVRQIVMVPKSAIGQQKKEKIGGQVIAFTFEGEDEPLKKKNNDFDCEAVITVQDSLYVFTKRRSDDLCGLYVLPKKPGSFVARLVRLFNTGGLITDAAINPANNTIALTGYQKSHKHPFVWLLKNYTGNDFFNGTAERIELIESKKQWQVESITFADENTVLIANEKTSDVAATLYKMPLDLLKKGSIKP